MFAAPRFGETKTHHYIPFSNDRLNFSLHCFAWRSLGCTCVGGFADQLGVVCALDDSAAGAGST